MRRISVTVPISSFEYSPMFCALITLRRIYVGHLLSMFPAYFTVVQKASLTASVLRFIVIISSAMGCYNIETSGDISTEFG